MNKKGQVTVFIILGIVILASVILVFYFTGDSLVKKSEEKNNIESITLKNYIEDCLQKTGNDALILIGKQGGIVNPVNYRLYENDKVNYLCYTPNDNSICSNLYPNLEGTIILDVNEYVTKKMKECVDMSLFREKGWNVKEEEMKVDTVIYDTKVVIELNYPVTIIKGDVVVKEDRFVEEFDIPLGKILDTVHEIIESEIKIGNFENLIYMNLNRGEIEVEKQIRDDSKVYIISLWQNEYKFKFSVRNLVR